MFRSGGVAVLGMAAGPRSRQSRSAKLKEFVFKHCRTSGSKDAYRLLSKAARLESKGELAGALAQYQAVKQKFAKTKAAHDAEASIRNLKRKTGETAVQPVREPPDPTGRN
jgi:hypothetical protein